MLQTHILGKIVLRSPAADESGVSGTMDSGLGLSTDKEQTGAITIARDGSWWHEGRPIPRKQLVKLFATVLCREDDGGYALVTPVERCAVEVEDAPFIAEEMEVLEREGQQVLAFRSNVEQWVEAGPDHPIRVAYMPDSDEPRPYILMKPGLEARIARSVFYRLVDLAEYGWNDGSEVLGVWSRGTFFPLDPTGAS